MSRRSPSGPTVVERIRVRVLVERLSCCPREGARQLEVAHAVRVEVRSDLRLGSLDRQRAGLVSAECGVE
eukprot:3111644-Prymnesium_polylepis.2